MVRFRLRRLLIPLLGILFAASVSASAVQATDMAVRMATASGAGDAGRCTECDDGGGDVKSTGCSMVACVAQVIAALPQTLIIIRIGGLDLPVPAGSSLVGWAHAPDPHPPRSGAPG